MTTDLTLHQRRRDPTAEELAGIPWLKVLKADEIERAVGELKVSDAMAGDYVCRVGRPVTYWFGVVEGLLKMSSDNAQGQTMTFTGMPPGGWFGEGTALKRESLPLQHPGAAPERGRGAAGRYLPLAAGPFHRLQPLRDEPAQRTAGAVHRGARDRPDEQPRPARRAQPRGPVQPHPLSGGRRSAAHHPAGTGVPGGAVAPEGQRSAGRARGAVDHPRRVRRPAHPGPGGACAPACSRG